MGLSVLYFINSLKLQFKSKWCVCRIYAANKPVDIKEICINLS